MSAERLYSIPWNLPKMTAPAMVNGVAGRKESRWCRSGRRRRAPAALRLDQRIQIPDEGAPPFRRSGRGRRWG